LQDKYHRLNIAELHDLAAKKNGKLISTVYKNVNCPVEWECHLNHRWFACVVNIKKGKWCPKCSGNKKLTIEFAKELAKQRGGLCLSNVYINSASKLNWKCKYGHLFQTSINRINSKNTWCPRCSFWSSEEICRIYFETIFKEKFEKIRPNWLTNDNGNKLELDGYCEKLNIAFEHNGMQHYENKPYNKLFSGKFNIIQKHDNIKKEICNKNGVKLIIIPQLFIKTKIVDLKRIIKQQCDFLHINLPSDFDNIIVNFDGTYIGSKIDKYIPKVISHGGSYVSGNYINIHTKIKWKCKHDHVFELNCSAIKKGTWCVECSGNKKLTIEYFLELAKKRNGQCLSAIYTNSNTKLKWKCNFCNNIWAATPGSINAGSWCPKCENKNRKITDAIYTNT